MYSSMVQVAGKHTPIYEAYYKQIDPKGTGNIAAMTAAKFLKKSGLSDVVLSRVSVSFHLICKISIQYFF